MTEINKSTPACRMTTGGDIYEAGNAREFKTGDWRSVRPVYIPEKCTQCGLCFPVCPDNAIPVTKEQKRTTSKHQSKYSNLQITAEIKDHTH